MRPKCGTIGETLTAIADCCDLTELERQYLQKRIAEEHAQLERLEKSRAQQRGVMLEVRILHGADHLCLMGLRNV
jgi:hypothetical protein